MSTTELTSQVQMPNEPIYDIASLGEGLTLKKRQTIELTPDFANSFLEHLEFTGERHLMENHVVFLARQMESASFRWELVTLATCWLEGKQYRINGQHTCWARIYAERLSKKARCPVQWLQYEAKTEQDLRQLYATFDRGKARNMGNVVVSYLSGRHELPDFTNAQLRRLAEGMAFWVWPSPEKRKLHTGDERACLLLTEYNTLAMRVGAFFKEANVGTDAKHINRMPCVAAMFATFSKAPQIALDFWRVTRDGVGVPNKDDARYRLRNYLMTTVLASSKGPGTPDLKVESQENMYRACLLAWNSFRTGKSVKLLRPSSTEDRPEVK